MNSFIFLLKICAWYGSTKLTTVLSSKAFMRLTSPSIYSYAIRNSGTEATLTRFVFALELYRQEHREKYPKSLDELCNGFMNEIPLDPFSQQPFRYVADDDCCGCLIYSIGANGINEDGRNDNSNPKGDDVRRRILPHRLALSTNGAGI